MSSKQTQAAKLLKGPILKSVGKQKKNLALDVALVQSLLNKVKLKPEAEKKAFLIKKPVIDSTISNDKLLTVNGTYSQLLVNEIKAFQGLYCNFAPDGSILPHRTTWKTLLKISGVKLSKASKIKVIFGDKAVQHTNILLNVNKVNLKTYIRNHLYIQLANNELESFLTLVFNDCTITNIYWAAYYIATAYHETGATFIPVIETGKGSGRSYGKAVNVTDTYGYRGVKGKVYKNIFYGRGYVQITHGVSYKYISEKLGLRKDELYINPDKALEVDLAYKILTYWMQNNIPKVKGKWRTIQENIMMQGKPDYVRARRIVNGTDEATKISDYAIVTEALIRLSAIK